MHKHPGSAAYLAIGLDRLDEAIALHEYAVARDPVNADGHYYLGRSYFWAGRLDAAVASLRTALTLSQEFPGAQYFLGTALLLKGEPEAALEAMQQESAGGWHAIGLSLAYHALGQAAESDAALAELIDQWEQGNDYHIALVFVARGEADRAFERLGKAWQYREPFRSRIAADFRFANIHTDPRWLPFLERIGHSPEQLAAIEFEVTLPE